MDRTDVLRKMIADFLGYKYEGGLVMRHIDGKWCRYATLQGKSSEGYWDYDFWWPDVYMDQLMPALDKISQMGWAIEITIISTGCIEMKFHKDFDPPTKFSGEFNTNTHGICSGICYFIHEHKKHDNKK